MICKGIHDDFRGIVDFCKKVLGPTFQVKSVFFFYTRWKHQEAVDCLVLSVGTEIYDTRYGDTIFHRFFIVYEVMKVCMTFLKYFGIP